MNSRLIIAAIMLSLLHSPARAHTITGHVTRVIDGDTICLMAEEDESTTLKVRLAAIDAPELKQPYGAEARDLLAELISGKRVRLDWRKRGRYGRLLGTIWMHGRNINETLVRTGHAWRYRYAKKTGPIAAAERQAHKRKLGLWQTQSATPPWVHRSNKEERP